MAAAEAEMAEAETGVKQMEVTFETPDRIVLDGRTFVLSPDSAAAGEAHRLEQERLAEAEQAKQAKEAELRAKAEEERVVLEAEETEAARVEAEAAAKKQAEEAAHQKRREQVIQDVKDGAEAEAKALEEKAAAAADTLKTEAATKAADIIQKAQDESDAVIEKAEAAAAELIVKAAQQAASKRDSAELLAQAAAEHLDEERQKELEAAEGGLNQDIIVPGHQFYGAVPGAPKAHNKHQAVTTYFGALWDEMPQQWFGKCVLGTKQHAIRESLDNPNKFKPRNATALVKEFFGQRWDKMDIQVKQDAVKQAIAHPERYSRSAFARNIKMIKHEAAQSAVYERQEAKYVCVKMDQTGGGQTHKPGLMTAVASQRCAACAASNVRVTDIDQRYRRGVQVAESWDLVCGECNCLTSCCWLQESAASFVGVHGADNWYDNQWDAVLAATLKTPLAAMKE